MTTPNSLKPGTTSLTKNIEAPPQMGQPCRQLMMPSRAARRRSCSAPNPSLDMTSAVNSLGCAAQFTGETILRR